MEAKGAEVFLRDQEGKPFAVKHRAGKGTVIYYESALTLAYAKRVNNQIQQWIAQPAKDGLDRLPVNLKQGSETITFRGLLHQDGPIAILSKWGESENVAVTFRGDYQVAELLTGAPVSVDYAQGLTSATLRLSGVDSFSQSAEQGLTGVWGSGKLKLLLLLCGITTPVGDVVPIVLDRQRY